MLTICPEVCLIIHPPSQEVGLPNHNGLTSIAYRANIAVGSLTTSTAVIEFELQVRCRSDSYLHDGHAIGGIKGGPQRRSRFTINKYNSSNNIVVWPFDVSCSHHPYTPIYCQCPRLGACLKVVQSSTSRVMAPFSR